MEREQLLKVMVPVGAFALLLILVGVVIALNTGGGTPSSAAGHTPNVTPTPDLPAPASAAEKFDFSLDGPEWKDLSGGLKMWEVKEGTGDVCPTLDERPNLVPVMHYTGWLTTGKMFDSSKTKGTPLTLPLSQLIGGWKQGVPGMKVGGVRRLLIPADLGYGARGQGQIPGGATLVFQMELLEIR